MDYLACHLLDIEYDAFNLACLGLFKIITFQFFQLSFATRKVVSNV